MGLIQFLGDWLLPRSFPLPIAAVHAPSRHASVLIARHAAGSAKRTPNSLFGRRLRSPRSSKGRSLPSQAGPIHALSTSRGAELVEWPQSEPVQRRRIARGRCDALCENKPVIGSVRPLFVAQTGPGRIRTGSGRAIPGSIISLSSRSIPPSRTRWCPVVGRRNKVMSQK